MKRTWMQEQAEKKEGQPTSFHSAKPAFPSQKEGCLIAPPSLAILGMCGELPTDIICSTANLECRGSQARGGDASRRCPASRSWTASKTW